MGKKLNFARAIVICHGFSEVQLSRALKSNLRIMMEIYSNKRGTSSIQITGLNKMLNKEPFRTSKSLQTEYSNVKINKGK